MKLFGRIALILLAALAVSGLTYELGQAGMVSAIAGTGSTAVVDVVPTVATTAKGTRPARKSVSIVARKAFGSIRRAESVGIFLSDSRP